MSSGNLRELKFHDALMRWSPTRVRCLQAGGPLDADEPPDTDLFSLLRDGYAVFVELQPGDGTRYGLLLTSGAHGINVMRIGALSDGSVRLSLDHAMRPEDCTALAPANEWTRMLLAWWLNELRLVGAGR
jgi:hypothetical protein